jgi:competence protein ComEC
VRHWAGVFTGRVWAPAAVALVVGGLLAESGAWQTPVGYAAAALWTLLAIALARRGKTLIGPFCAWCAVLCWAAVAASPVHVTQTIPAVDLAVGHNASRQLVLRPDGTCRLHGDRITWTADWLASCAVGPAARCEARGGKLAFSGVQVDAVRGAGQVRFIGTVVPPHGHNNPGTSFGLARATRLGIVGAVRGRLIHSDTGQTSGPDLISRARTAQCATRRTLSARLRRPAVDLGLIAALTIGNRGDLDRRLTAVLRRTGTAHLLAVSGTHVGLLVGGVLALLLFACRVLPYRVVRALPCQAVASLAAVGVGWLYVLLAGTPASAARAMAMATAALAHWNVGRSPDLLESLGFAVACILIWQPSAVADVGLQLSILGVIGVAWAASVEGDRGSVRWRQALRASTLAWITTSIVSVAAFGQITWVAPFANLLLIPYFAFVVLPAAMLTMMWALVVWAVGAPVLAGQSLLDPVLALITAPLSLLSTLPLHVIPISVPGRDCAVFAGLLLVAAAAVWLHMPRIGRLVAVACVLAAAAVGPVHRFVDRPANGGFSAVFFDVGHGDAALLRFADGTNMLVDGGGRPMDDGALGASVLVPALRAVGVRRIDRMVLSHADADHENGLLAVARHMRVGELWYSGDPAKSREHRALLASLAAQQSRWRRLPVSPWSATRLQVGGTAVQVRLANGPGLSRNDRSLVLAIGSPDVSLLLTGDIEADAEAALSASPLPHAAIRVLKVPHHGSKTSSTPALLRWSKPAFAVVSGRPWAQHQLPATSIVRRYKQQAIPLWSTAAGAIELQFRGRSITLKQGLRSARLITGTAPPQPCQQTQSDRADDPSG